MHNYLDTYTCAEDISFVEGEDGINVFRASKLLPLEPELARLVSVVAALPHAGVDDLASAMTTRTGEVQLASDLLGRLDSLEIMGLLQKKRIKKPRRSSKFLAHHCQNCGCSCQAQLVGPLSEKELENIETARLSLSPERPENLNPIMKGMLKDGSSLHFLNFPQKRCSFLNNDNLCMIHAKHGAMHKPAACRRFPYAAIETESEYRLAIKPYCYHANLSFDTKDDALLPSEDLLTDLWESTSFRPILRNGSEQELAKARLEEMLVLGWLVEDLSYCEFLTKVLERSENSEFSSDFIRFMQDIFQNMAKNLLPSLLPDANTTHIAHGIELLEAIAKLELPPPNKLSLSERQWAYAKSSLHSAVYLREVSRFPSIAAGALVLALGVWLAAACATNEDAKFYQHFTAYLRLMAQTQAFTFLLPSPEVLAILMQLANA